MHNLCCRAGECQLYIDVDCSDVTYDSNPSPAVLEAVNNTLGKLDLNETKDNIDEVKKPKPFDWLSANSTVSDPPKTALANSLLSSMDPDKASENEIREAFCRDVDSFSWEFAQPDRSTLGVIVDFFSEHYFPLSIIGVVLFFLIIKAIIKMSEIRQSSNSSNGVTFSNARTEQPPTNGIEELPYRAVPGGHHNSGQPDTKPVQKLPDSAQQPTSPPTEPPPYSLDDTPYHPANTTPYPPADTTPYPTANTTPYPTANTTPYPLADTTPYPPVNATPYPPATSTPHPPAGADKLPYPIAPPDNTGSGVFNSGHN